jgi:hypothetical protein
MEVGLRRAFVGCTIAVGSPSGQKERKPKQRKRKGRIYRRREANGFDEAIYSGSRVKERVHGDDVPAAQA